MSSSIISSVVTGGSNSAQTVSEELNAYATDFVNQGVWGTITLGAGSTAGTGSFAVSQDASPDMGVTVASGVAYVAGTPSGQDAQVLRARMTTNYTSYTITANSSGSTKYDWIYLSLSSSNANNPSSAKDNVITLYTSRSSSNSSDNGTPPTYGILLAVVTVANGASSITNSNISDRRTQASLSSVNSGSTTGWNALGYGLTYSANNGNKEFVVTTPNNLSTLLSPGMKLSVARTTTPPTQSMAFTSSSSQYATKSSPTGITFTSAFTCEAWIYLNSYTGSGQTILNRTTGTSSGGWDFEINTNGQVRAFYGSGSSFTDFISYQSVPLNQWVHVAVAVTSTSSKTAVIYINGNSVPNYSALTAATSLTQQSVDLRLGASNYSGVSGYFNGYISEARLWSVAQSSTNIQANMAINLTGSETNLIGLWQGGGNFADATSNGNTLTANNGAIATQAANPYNATEYAVITSVSYSSPTTTIKLYTGNQNTIPNQTLGTVYFSTVREPYGFNADRGNWSYYIYYPSYLFVPTSGTWYNPASSSITVPAGSWKVGYELANLRGAATGSSNSYISVNSVLSITSANTGSLQEQYYWYASSAIDGVMSSGSTMTCNSPVKREGFVTLSTDTTYYLNYILTTGATVFSSSSQCGFGGNYKIYAECTYI